MAYTAPTATDLKARFPEFASVGDPIIQAILDGEVIPAVGVSWIEADRRPAQLYLAAHLLTLEGEPGRSSGEGASIILTGPVKRRKVGDVETEFAGAASSISGSGSSSNAFDRSVYGQRYLDIMRRNFPAVAVV